MKETKKYKQTELGMLPDDWEVVKLGNCLSIGNGRDYKHLKGGSIPVYGTGGIMCYVNEYLYDGATVCIGRKGTIDVPIYHEGKIWTVDTLFYTHSFVGIIPKYAYYLFNQINWKSLNEATGVPSLSKVNILSKEMALPPISEQSRIATALSAIDNLISELGKLIEKKRAIKQGAMQQLLTGKKRLKGFNEPWMEYEIRNICEVKRGVRIVKNQLNTESEFPVFQNTNMPLGYFDNYNVNECTPFVIIGGSAGQIGICYTKYWAADDCAYFECSNMILKEFLYLILLHNQKMILQHVRTGTVPRLDRSVLQKMRIRIPSNKQEQYAITNICSNMEKEVTHLEVKKAKYENIKQGMMQQLLTGKIRLVETAVKPNATSANVHFRRSVLAAEIAERLYNEPTFGHVKMEKMLFLTERLCHIDIGSHYHRDAAGPYDNKALRSIDSQLKNQKWFEAQKTEKGYRYVPLQDHGKHKTYFNRYYSDVVPMFDRIINTFKSQRTEQCEIVATLYSAWEDLLRSNKPFNDADIANEVLNNWHESKKRISQDRWLKAIQWMRDNGFAPDNN